MVAENMIVWQVAGNCFAIVMMSSANPMSSMRSASSRIKKLTFDKSTFPRDICEIKRPGVAITTSAPNARLFNS